MKPVGVDMRPMARAAAAEAVQPFIRNEGVGHDPTRSIGFRRAAPSALCQKQVEFSLFGFNVFNFR
jgi:hypothetical protein